MGENKTLWILAWIFIFCLLMETQMIRGVMKKQEVGDIKLEIKQNTEIYDLQAELQEIKAKKWHR